MAAVPDYTEVSIMVRKMPKSGFGGDTHISVCIPNFRGLAIIELEIQAVLPVGR